MELLQLQKLVSQGEGQHLEFKRKVREPKKIIRELVAFANTSGGSLLIGVNDNLHISGVKYPEEEAFILEEAIQKFCKPVFTFQKEEIEIRPNRFIIKYDVPASNRRPHYLIEKFNPFIRFAFVRIKDESIKASKEVVEIIKYSKAQNSSAFTFGSDEKSLFQYLEKNNKITVKEFQLVANLSYSSASEKLVNLVSSGVLQVLPGGNEDYYFYKNNTDDSSNSFFYGLI